MTTSQPSLAVEIAQAADQRGVVSIDAPVSGGDVGARNGTLSIMVGGDAETFAALDPLFKRWAIHPPGRPGRRPAREGDQPDSDRREMIGVCESLLYGYQAGLDLKTVLESVASGAAGSWSLSNLAPRIIAGNFDPGFFVEHFLKDMGIALDESRRMGLKLRGLELAEQLYRDVAAQGMGRHGTQSLILALAKASGAEWQQPGD